MICKDDTVITLWSYSCIIRQPLYNILAGTSNLTLHQYEFHAARIKHPTSECPVSLISAPSPEFFGNSAIREGLQYLLTHIETIGAKFMAHIWVHSIGQSSSLLVSSGKPRHWSDLEGILGNMANMDQVVFLTTNWEHVTQGIGQKEELKIQEALREPVEEGLIFERLTETGFLSAWGAVQRVICASSGDEAEVRKKMGVQKRVKREEEKKEINEEWRIGQIQPEIDELYAQLNKTEDGRRMCARLKKAAADQDKYMVPLLAQTDRVELEPEEKAILEKKIEEEYLLCLREFRGHFEELRLMGFSIGFNLREFYGLRDPERSKKRRWGLFTRSGRERSTSVD